MDPVHDIPPAARLQHDPLQVFSGTLTAIAAVMDRYAWQRERVGEAADRDLAAARRELRDAQRIETEAVRGAPTAAAPESKATPPPGPRAVQRARTVGPAQEEAAVLAAHYARVPGHAGAGDTAAAWLARATRAARGTPWRATADGTRAWASAGTRPIERNGSGGGSRPWTAQAEQLAANPEVRPAPR